MKPYFFLAILVSASFLAVAQEKPLLVIHKNYTDSLSTHKNNAGSTLADVYKNATGGQVWHATPGEPIHIDEISPNAQLLTSNSLGRVYSLRPDNMPVLVPSMALVEQMPGSSRIYTPAPPSSMPNPLYRPRLKGNNPIK